MFTLSDMMFVNADTLTSLQIIQSENHPNSHTQGPNRSTSGSKESLSVYGLFQFLASTPQGRHKLRLLFLRPSMNLPLIQKRLYTIKTLLRPENQSLLEGIVSSLNKIKDIRAVVIHLQKGISNIPRQCVSINSGVWASLRNFTFHILKIFEAFNELSNVTDLAIAKQVIVQHCIKTLTNIIRLVLNRDQPRSTQQDRTIDYRDCRLSSICRAASHCRITWCRC